MLTKPKKTEEYFKETKMKCYLHIGTEKTGTTTLQHFFHTNRQELLKNGFLFTKSAGLTNNFLLPVAVYNKERRDDLTNRQKIYSDDELSQFQKKILKELKKEISKKQKSNVIFSSEHIQSRLTTIEELKRLKESLHSMGIDEIKIIVYLRNPVEIAKSLYSTSIINGHTLEKPPSPKNKYFNNVCHHKNTLIRYETVFGRENIIPRIFEKDSLKNGSIIHDFFDILQLNLTPDFKIPEDKNKSLSPLGLDLLRRLNHHLPLFVDNKLNPLRGDIVDYFQKVFNDKKYVMPKKLVEEYEESFKESNEWVRKNWFPHKSRLFSKVTYQDETTITLADNELNQIASLLFEIWTKKKQ